MDATTRETSPPSPSPVSPPRLSSPAAPATLWLVRWGLVLHAGLWALITVAHAVGLAAGTASTSAAGSWVRLVLATGMAAALGVAGYRIGPGRPFAWVAAVVLQVLAAAGYAELTLALLSDRGQSLAPDLLTLLVGVALVLLTLAGVVLTATGPLRAYCTAARS